MKTMYSMKTESTLAICFMLGCVCLSASEGQSLNELSLHNTCFERFTDSICSICADRNIDCGCESGTAIHWFSVLKDYALLYKREKDYITNYDYDISNRKSVAMQFVESSGISLLDSINGFQQALSLGSLLVFNTTRSTQEKLSSTQYSSLIPWMTTYFLAEHDVSFAAGQTDDHTLESRMGCVRSNVSVHDEHSALRLHEHVIDLSRPLLMKIQLVELKVFILGRFLLFTCAPQDVQVRVSSLPQSSRWGGIRALSRLSEEIRASRPANVIAVHVVSIAHDLKPPKTDSCHNPVKQTCILAISCRAEAPGKCFLEMMSYLAACNAYHTAENETEASSQWTVLVLLIADVEEAQKAVSKELQLIPGALVLQLRPVAETDIASWNELHLLLLSEAADLVSVSVTPSWLLIQARSLIVPIYHCCGGNELGPRDAHLSPLAVPNDQSRPDPAAMPQESHGQAKAADADGESGGRPRPAVRKKVEDAAAATGVRDWEEDEGVVFAGSAWDGGPLPSVDPTVVHGWRMPRIRPLPPGEDWRTPAAELRGQISLETTFGRELRRLAGLPEVHLVLELGTWYGGGSSWCLAQGLRESTASPARPDKWLFTVELFEQAWKHAVQTLARLPVTCLLGGTVPWEEYLKPEEVPEEDRAGEHFLLYYERDLRLARSSPTLLRALCERYDFDLVLIDGSEYAGYAEFLAVEAKCRPRYIALHDLGTLKTTRVEEALLERPGEWRALSAGEDPVWAVYERAPPALRLLSIDFHVGPVADVKHVAAAALPGVEVLDLSLSGRCWAAGTCAGGRLAVLREADPAHSLRFSQATREEFFATGAGAGDLMRAADAMLCSHPVGMCELAMPFNRTAVVWATTRFDLGREGNRTRLAGLVGNLRALARGPGLVAVANNLYDAHYLNYFTGAMPALLPSLGAYAPAAARWQWDGVEDRVLVWGFRPGGAVAAEFLNQLEAAAPGLGFEHARSVYPGEFDMADLARHPAILHAPYQVSTMSLFEHYSLCIPILAPSPRLLARWHMDFGLVSERCFESDGQAKGSLLPRHEDAIPRYRHDPNDDSSEEALLRWLSYSDLYALPHILLFDDVAPGGDLTRVLTGVDFRAVSADMCKTNIHRAKATAAGWDRVLRRVVPAASRGTPAAAGYKESMDLLYGQAGWHAY